MNRRNSASFELERARLSRREAGVLIAALASGALIPRRLLAAADHLGAGRPFSRTTVIDKAKALASRTFVPPPVSATAAADFDAYVKMTYGPAQTLPGNLRLFPTSRGSAPSRVAIALVANGVARPLVSTEGLFTGSSPAEPAGFRVMDEDQNSDWLAYMGASYFRASGSTNQYGISARGIAVDTGTGGPEEFPAFTEFWIEPVAAGHLRVHALLDGPSLTGAYAFDCRKDGGIVQDVSATLFFRRDIARLGLAPASSMFWYDQSGTRHDWRPEIHDSDGLAIQAGGERVWRPLSNPSVARTSAFRADNPTAFGLIQRDQTFGNYQDDGAFYDKRPSLWVTPSAGWGPGSVMLYEMPTNSETQDNIAAFWTPDRQPRRGGTLSFGYRLTWTSKDPSADASSRCVDLYEGPAGIAGAQGEAGGRKFVFDFAGPALHGLTRESGVSAATDLPSAAVIRSAAYPVVGEQDRWRVMLDVAMDKIQRPEFRLYLKRGEAALSETVIKAFQR